MSRTSPSPLFALALVALQTVVPALADSAGQAASGTTKVSSCDQVRAFCAVQCSRLPGGDARNCVQPCEREEADASDLNCGQVHPTPLASSCEEVLEFCATKRCRFATGVFRDACHLECPRQVALRNKLQCAFPPDGAGRGVRHGPAAATSCAQVATNCARECAGMAPQEQAPCSKMCPKLHAAMSKLACSPQSSTQ